MSADREFELLSDLAKLLDKYGPKVFESLARHLAEPEFLKSLEIVLSESPAVLSKSRRRPSSVSKASPHGKIWEILRRLENSEPEKSKALGQFYDSLLMKAILPTLRDIRTISGEAGLPPVKAKSRDKALAPLMRSLITLPLPEIESLRSRAELMAGENDRSLEGWSRIILEDRKPSHE